MPSCIILRGLPGSGKSTIAEKLKRVHGGVVVSADRHMTFAGVYKFNPTKLGACHSACFDDFCQHVRHNYPVIVDNTNTTRREYQRYVDYAKEHGYNVTIITVETDLTDEELAKRNVHGVPVETIKRMRERMKHG